MHINFDELIAALQDCCSRSKIAFENGMKFEIDSREVFTRIKIDNCLIASQQVQKCDFGFVRHSNDEFYFVELKGKNIETAVDQIISTIKIFDSDLIKIPQGKRFGFIVSSRNPLSDQKIRNLKQDFAKKYGHFLVIKNKYCPYVPKKLSQ
ncbi:hypothetical protein [Flavobacterium sp. HJJ]|uniref:hypothetical protein n=1 Tax=Flavobacterium sp. HJJ TaxID=2783792 RepID=UPI00188B6094|nr:hypothetical protein [Flavobacterium sp. HJJ]MBF4471318.1 hypothetical protein [Flavobacterium sp. HJJ]